MNRWRKNGLGMGGHHGRRVSTIMDGEYSSSTMDLIIRDRKIRLLAVATPLNVRVLDSLRYFPNPTT